MCETHIVNALATGQTSLPGPALLFCPANRPERYAKAAERADIVVLDLEDAVPPAEKDIARLALIDNPLDPMRTIVRINPTLSIDHRLDLAAIRQTGYRMVMLAKTETADQATALAPYEVIALCETPLGILNAPTVAAANNVIALMWGSEDLVAALGGRASRDDTGRLHDVAQQARTMVLLAAKAFGRQAIDTVFTAFRDAEALAREARDAATAGFDLKACIHPDQVPVVTDSFRPSPAQLEWAAQVLAAEVAGGVISVNGQMIDEPLLRQARSIASWHHRADRGGQ
jgi:citrate lyase subunit beta/citryl-CoA lyase